MRRTGNSFGRRLTAFVLLMSMLITAIHAPAKAATVTAYSAVGTVINITTDLVVRKKASKSGQVMGSLENGDKVLITGKTSNWYRIYYGTSTAYVSKAYISAKALTNSKVISFSSKASINVEGNLNVRKKASSSATVIGSLTDGTNVTITGVTKDWYRIKYKSSTGFVSKKYVAVGVTTTKTSSGTTTTSSTKTTSSSTTKVGTVNVNTSLCVRKSASKTGSVIGALYKGDQVTITGSKGDFYKISYEGSTAYVMKVYITNVKTGSASKTTSSTSTTTTKTSTSTSTSSTTVTKVSKTGYADVSTSLIARSKPSSNASVIGRYSSGAKIKITGELTNWYRVSYSGNTAYVNAAYVTFTAPKKSSSSESSSTTTTTTKTITSYKSIELDVPLYHQYDSRWASVAIGSTTLKANGCAVTSLAMVEEYRTGDTCTPPMMVKKLNFTSSGAVYWPNGTTAYTGSNYLSVIYKQLAAGNPVVLGGKYTSGSQHYCVIYGYNGSTSSLSTSGFLVNDPGTGGTKTLKAFFARTPSFYKLIYYV